MHFFLRILPGFFLLIGFISCKKYPEGPAFSLQSKKARVVNTWAIDQYLEDGVDKTDAYLSGYTDYSLQVFKDGSYTMNWYSLNAPFTESGDWAFANDKQELVMDPGSGNAPPREYVILKLKGRELWLQEKNSTVKKETRYKKKK